MTYKIVVPLAGFEEETQLSLEQIDEFFSFIKTEPDGIEIRVINLQNIKDIGFDISEEFVEKLKLTDKTRYSIYYIFVLQNPVEKSVVNLLAPLIFNDDENLVGQIQLDEDGLGIEILENLME